jgi:MFS family permease
MMEQKEVRPRLEPHISRSQLLSISALWFGMNFFWSAILPIWLPVRVHDFAGASKGTYMFYITSSGAVLSTIIQLVIGPVSDRTTLRWGRRRPYILWGVLATLPSLLIFAGAPTFGMLLLGFVLIQITVNVATGPYQAVMPDVVPEQKHGLASAYMGFALLLGSGVALPLAGMLVGGKLLGDWSPQGRLWALAGITLFVLLATMLWTVLGTREKPLPPADKKPLTLADIFDIRLRGERDFAWLIISRFFINLGFYTATFFIEYYVSESIGLGDKAPAATGLLFLIVTYAGLLGNWPAGIYADRTSKKRVLYITCSVLALAVLWFLLVKSMTWVYVVGLVFGVGWGAFAAVDWALAANLVPMKEAGRYMAIWHLAWTLPQVVAPAVGPLADKVNHIYGHGLGWRVALGFILIYLVLGVLCIRPIRERPVKREA